MKAPESALARKILNDPRKAESLVTAILATRESREDASPALVDGKLTVSMVGKVSPIGQSSD